MLKKKKKCSSFEIFFFLLLIASIAWELTDITSTAQICEFSRMILNSMQNRGKRRCFLCSFMLCYKAFFDMTFICTESHLYPTKNIFNVTLSVVAIQPVPGMNLTAYVILYLLTW